MEKRRINAVSKIGKEGEEALLIDIENDGIPFDEELQKLVNEGKKFSGSEHSTRIGISNIKNRISYLCGEPYGLKVEVQDGHTKIHICLPIQEQEKGGRQYGNRDL